MHDDAASDGHDPVSQSLSALRLVRGQDHGRTLADCAANQVVEQIPVFGVQAGVRLIEKPQLRIGGQQGRERHSASLAGGERPDGGLA